MEKRGQIKISFGMIFSIILIVIFLAFAFYVIKIFIGWGSQATATQFMSKFQSDVTNMWGESGSQPMTYSVPSGINYVCFIDTSSGAKGQYSSMYTNVKFDAESNNLVLYPAGQSDVGNILHLDMNNITSNDNPYCVEVSNGKVTLTIEKGFSSSLVSVS